MRRQRGAGRAPGHRRPGRRLGAAPAQARGPADRHEPRHARRGRRVAAARRRPDRGGGGLRRFLPANLSAIHPDRLPAARLARRETRTARPCQCHADATWRWRRGCGRLDGADRGRLAAGGRGSEPANAGGRRRRTALGPRLHPARHRRSGAADNARGESRRHLLRQPHRSRRPRHALLLRQRARPIACAGDASTGRGDRQRLARGRPGGRQGRCADRALLRRGRWRAPEGAVGEFRGGGCDPGGRCRGGGSHAGPRDPRSLRRHQLPRLGSRPCGRPRPHPRQGRGLLERLRIAAETVFHAG